MKYRVVWRRIARDQLALIWTTAPDRAAVTEAANAIDALLERNPSNCGESREGNQRILIERPLVVVFAVDEQQKKVVVLSVRLVASQQ
jgi:plasmid stabilization system protein ParE